MGSTRRNSPTRPMVLASPFEDIINAAHAEAGAEGLKPSAVSSAFPYGHDVYGFGKTDDTSAPRFAFLIRGTAAQRRFLLAHVSASITTRLLATVPS